MSTTYKELLTGTVWKLADSGCTALPSAVSAIPLDIIGSVLYEDENNTFLVTADNTDPSNACDRLCNDTPSWPGAKNINVFFNSRNQWIDTKSHNYFTYTFGEDNPWHYINVSSVSTTTLSFGPKLVIRGFNATATEAAAKRLYDWLVDENNGTLVEAKSIQLYGLNADGSIDRRDPFYPRVRTSDITDANNLITKLGLYTKPGSGIPETDLSQEVRTKLNSGGGLTEVVLYDGEPLAAGTQQSVLNIPEVATNFKYLKAFVSTTYESSSPTYCINLCNAYEGYAGTQGGPPEGTSMWYGGLTTVVSFSGSAFSIAYYVNFAGNANPQLYYALGYSVPTNQSTSSNLYLVRLVGVK